MTFLLDEKEGVFEGNGAKSESKQKRGGPLQLKEAAS